MYFCDILSIVFVKIDVYLLYFKYILCQGKCNSSLKCDITNSSACSSVIFYVKVNVRRIHDILVLRMINHAILCW